MNAVTSFLDSVLSHEVVVSLISMIPLIELRGAIIYGFAAEMNPVFLYFLCVAMNCVPVPFVILFIRRIMDWLRKYPKMDKIITKLEGISDSKSGQITKYKYQLVGLCLFVAIPLPGTGAYSGALVAALLGMDKKKSMAAICIGVAIAGLIMTLACTSLSGVLGWIMK